MGFQGTMEKNKDRKLEWSSYALEVVKEINSSAKPIEWHAMYDLLAIKHRFIIYGWKIEWNPRTSN